MAGTIGIKVANGNFYPLMGENSAVRKKLVLTTVHDNQDSVQIDLFRSISKSMLDAQYIGSLVVEDIRSALKGEPSIEMIVSADPDGNITAEAYDLDAEPGSDHHLLNVSLRTMDTLSRPDDFPDFDMDGDGLPQHASLSFDKDRLVGERKRRRKFPWVILAVAVLLVILGVLLFFPIRGGDETLFASIMGQITEQTARPQDVPPPEPVAVEPVPLPPPLPPVVQPAPPETVPTPVTPEPPVVAISPPDVSGMPVVEASPPDASAMPVVEVSPPVIQAPVTPPVVQIQAVPGQRPPAPVMSHRVPAVIPPNGVVYQIRWGDTLWDIAAAFYRDPLQYPRIARHNNIRNPNLILAGFNVRIPPLD